MSRAVKLGVRLTTGHIDLADLHRWALLGDTVAESVLRGAAKGDGDAAALVRALDRVRSVRAEVLS